MCSCYSHTLADSGRDPGNHHLPQRRPPDRNQRLLQERNADIPPGGPAVFPTRAVLCPHSILHRLSERRGAHVPCGWHSHWSLQENVAAYVQCTCGYCTDSDVWYNTCDTVLYVCVFCHMYNTCDTVLYVCVFCHIKYICLYRTSFFNQC